MKPNPKIHSSHLALRFYKNQGWTREILQPYLVRGKFTDQIEGQEVRNYYLLQVGGAFDTDRLFNDLKPRVFHYNDHELFGDEALAYMKDHNW